MSTEATMTTYTWIIHYSEFRPPDAGGSIPTTISIEAAYFTLDEHLIVFKDPDHQVVFGMPAAIISTVHRDDAPVRWDQDS